MSSVAESSPLRHGFATHLPRAGEEFTRGRSVLTGQRDRVAARDRNASRALASHPRGMGGRNESPSNG